MAEFPSLPLFTDAYLADTIHLSTREHGAYLLLLITAWRTPDCCLPNDDKLLAKYTRMSIGRWRKMRPTLEQFFTIDDNWNQKRLTKERVYVNKLVQRNTDAANTRWHGKPLKTNSSGNASASSTHMLNGCESDAPTPTPIPTLKKKKEYTSKRESQFDEFWGVFAYKNGRVPALKAWMKISGYDDALFVQILAGAKRDAAARPDLTARGITPKMAQGWITDRRWEDEMPPVTTPIGPQAMLG